MSATELTEAADFLEANGWLPTTLGTPTVEAVAAPLLPGDKGRIVAALREAAAGAPETTRQEREQARQLWIDLGRSEMAEPTPHQLLAFLRQCPESVGLLLAQQALRTAAEASRCAVLNHDGQIDAHPAALAAAREEGRASVGLADFLPGGCDVETRAPNYHFSETYGDWLDCTRSKGHDGEHEHEDSGFTWPRNDDEEPRP